MKVLQLLMSLTCLIVLGLFSGCAVKVERPIETPFALPTSFSDSGSSALSGKWWLAFEDDALNKLIEQSLNDNFSLKSSWARLSQANAVYKKSSSGLFPTIEGDAGGSHIIDYKDGTTVKSDKLTLGLSASYEIDLWGRIDSEIEAARLDMEATAADLDAAAMTLSAEVADTWYRLIRHKASLELYDQQIKTNFKALDLITTQMRTGQVPIADVLQQRQLIESQQGEKAQLISEVGQTEHRLTILLGRVPGIQNFEVPVEIAALPDLPVTGIPAELIRQRPDIHSSYLVLKAADERVAAAVANQYPSLRFTVSLETINGSASSLFDNYISSIIAGITAPLFDGGLRRAEVERSQGVVEQALSEYGQAVLTAVGEVEDALLFERQQQQYIHSLEAQLDYASLTMEQLKERYLKGIENYQRVLTALTSLQSLEQKLITAKTDLLLNRVDLCRALGTGWDYSKKENNA